MSLSRTISDVLTRFTQARLDVPGTVAEWKKRQGGKAVGCFPMYVPEEILHAAGLLPITLPGGDGETSRAAEHLWPYTCHPARGNFDLMLRGDLDFLDGFVFAQVCEESKKIGTTWPIYRTGTWHAQVRYPERLDTLPSREYLLCELRRFKGAVEAFVAKPISNQALNSSIVLFNRTRELLSQLYQLRSAMPELFTCVEIENVVSAAPVMPKEEYNGLLEWYLGFKREQVSPSDGRVRLVVAGNPCEDLEPGLSALLDESGAMVVDDDLWFGARYFAGPVALTGDPIDALADAQFQTPPCPLRLRFRAIRCAPNEAVPVAADYSPDGTWAHHVLRVAQSARAHGVVLMIPKFCEIYPNHYPQVRDVLDEAGIASIMLDTDHDGAIGQVRTRLQAFIEMVVEAL